MTTNAYNIAVIAGDGIGNEVMPEAIKVLEAVGRKYELSFKFDEKDWSCERFHKTGLMMPEDGLVSISRARRHSAWGRWFPGVPDHISLWGLLIPIRRDFQQYVALRPSVYSRNAVPAGWAGASEIDFFIVRENNEGEYSEIGGRMYKGTDNEAAIQQSIFTRIGTDRIMRYVEFGN